MQSQGLGFNRLMSSILVDGPQKEITVGHQGGRTALSAAVPGALRMTSTNGDRLWPGLVAVFHDTVGKSPI
jgi:hypothetical protein